MDIKDFTIVTCKNNHYNILYGAKGLSQEELKDEFDAGIVDGKIATICHCGEKMVEISSNYWSEQMCSEVLGNMLEDDNRHSLTGIGYLISDIMKKKNFTKEQRADVIKGLLEHYNENHSLRY